MRSINVNTVADGLGKGIDELIKHTVVCFRKAGFDTSASCQGYLHRGLPFPWIDIDNLAGKELQRLQNYIDKFGNGRLIAKQYASWIRVQQPLIDGHGKFGGCDWEAVRLTVSPEDLKQFRKEMDYLAEQMCTSCGDEDGS